MTQQHIRSKVKQALSEQFGDHYKPDLSLKQNGADRTDLIDLEDIIEHLLGMDTGTMKQSLRYDMDFDFIVKATELKMR